MILLPTPENLVEIDNDLAEGILVEIVTKQVDAYHHNGGTTSHFVTKPPRASENEWAVAMCVATIELTKRGWMARQIRDEHGEYIQILNPWRGAKP